MSAPILAIVGPTASGKTALALALARQKPIEIVNADSLQIFRGLDIGSAKPTLAERAEVRHHAIDCYDPDDASVNAFSFAALARSAIDDIRARGKIPLVVGGAGFYLQAIEHPPAPQNDDPPPSIGLDQARALIHERDPDLWNFIHSNDSYRILRAAKRILAGETPSQERKNPQTQGTDYPLSMLVLDPLREELNARIDRRVEEMMNQGLVEETQGVLRDFPKAEPRLAKAIGYRETLLFLRREISREEMRQSIQQATRQYAKRQRTWFRARPRTQWVGPEDSLPAALGLLQGAG